LGASAFLSSAGAAPSLTGGPQGGRGAGAVGPIGGEQIGTFLAPSAAGFFSLGFSAGLGGSGFFSAGFTSVFGGEGALGGEAGGAISPI
jgi:hypothetical protein